MTPSEPSVHEPSAHEPGLHEISALELWQRIHDREVSVAEVAAHFLDRIEHHDDAHAFVAVDDDRAMERARALDAAADRTPVIFGMPLADKDLWQRAGRVTTFGSRIHAGFVPSTTDAVPRALDASGGVSLGATASPEFGLAGFTSSALHGHTTIPGHPGFGAGGSSGGAAAAVAAGLVPFAPGSDGGGSIRIPAAACGLVGLKPSRGRIPAASGHGSLGGLVVAGPIARTVTDAALLTDALIGRVNGRVVHDTTLRSPECDDGSLLAAAVRGEGRFRIAVLHGTPWDAWCDIVIDPEATAAQEVALRELAAAGHEIESVRMPAWPGYADAFSTLWRAGAATIPVHGEGLALLEPLTRWLLEAGRAMPATELAASLAACAAFEREVVGAFAPFDAVLSPATALTPRPVGWFSADPAENFVQQVQYTPHTSFVNVTGLPAITLPVHRTRSGVPMGVQFVGRPGDEATLLAIGRQLERRIPWEQRIRAAMP